MHTKKGKKGNNGGKNWSTDDLVIINNHGKFQLIQMRTQHFQLKLTLLWPWNEVNVTEVLMQWGKVCRIMFMVSKKIAS